MNIAMISYHTCPLATLGGKDTGGMNVYVKELTRHLGRLGVHVDVFTRSQDDHVPHVLHDLGYGNRVVHISAGPEIPLAKEELTTFIPQFSEGILDFAAKKDIKYDIIHSHYWMSGIAAIELKTIWKTPIIHMFHTLGLMKNRIAQSKRELEGEYRISGEYRVLTNSDLVIAATLAEQTQLEFLYHANRSKLRIIPPGVDIAHFYPIPADEARDVIGVPQDTCLIMFVGRIEPLKGLDILIRAIAHVAKYYQVPGCPIHLAIIGGEPDRQPQDLSEEMGRLQQLCDDLGIGDIVIFLGKRSQDSLPYFYSAANMIVVPSHYESFGMVALEAMACGTPVVASQVGGLAFLVEDGVTGYMVPYGDHVALADRLIQLLNDKSIRKKLSQNAIAKAKSYSWGNIARQIQEVYDKLLSSPKDKSGNTTASSPV